MKENRLMEQVTAIFSVFMVLFYLGIGCYIVFFFRQSYLDRSVLVILGSSFILYGFYRAFRAYVKIVELFFTKGKD